MSYSPPLDSAQHLSRVDSTTSSANVANFGSHRPQPPNSPPLSSSGSQIGFASSPNPSVLTPPASVPMSAEPSQQSLTVAVPPNHVAEIANNSSPTSNNSPTGVPIQVNTTDSTQRQPSLKRSLEDDSSGDTSNKRRRTDEPSAEPERPNIPDSNSSPISHSIPLYRFESAPHSFSRPHPSQDLISLYNLNEIAASVARKDPATGEKINKLRKSYEGKIKELGIPGKNKATSNYQEMYDIIAYPDEEWQIQKVHGKDVIHGLRGDMIEKLNLALKMEPGKLPQEENEKWRNSFDLDVGQSRTMNIPQGSKKIGAADAAIQNSTSVSTPNHPPRPLRRGTKRRYNDDSFEGYGEGFVDDNGETISIDEDEERGGSSSKKRRRETGGSPPFASGIGQYASSSVSVGGGLYSTR